MTTKSATTRKPAVAITGFSSTSRSNRTAPGPDAVIANCERIETALNRVHTQRGDPLILRTSQSFTLYAVGLVSYDGQQDFHAQTNVKYVTDHAMAVAEAKALLAPGRPIFLRDIDTGDWFEIAG